MKVFTQKRFKVIVISLTVLVLLSVIISLHLGSYKVGTLDILKTLVGQGTTAQEITIFQSRLPRIVIAILVGASLAIAGTVLQGVTRNDLADSGILGINSGAALFVVVYMFLMNGNVQYGVSNLTIFTMPLVALLGAGFGGFLIYILSYNKGINPNKMLLIGIGINVAFTSLLTVFQLRFTTQEFNKVVAWTSGSIWGTNWKYVLAVLPFVLVFGFLTMYKSRYLDALNLGDNISTGLGVNVEKERRKLIVYAVVLSGVATSVAGSIAFLGLIAPHIARKIVGPKHKRLIPVAALIGTIILLVSDAFSKNLLPPIEIPVGIIVAVVGVPYFIYLMLSE